MKKRLLFKFILVVLVIAVMLMAFASCGKGDSPSPDNPDTPDKPDMPDKPDTPDTPDVPDTPDNPDNPDTPDVPTEDYKTEEFWTQNGSKNIYCKLYFPNDELASHPAVILSHSAFLTGNSLAAYAKGFADRGYVACTFDFCGGSNSSKSDGKVKEMTIFSEVADLKAVISAVSAREDVTDGGVLLVGTSQGGLVTALTANGIPEAVSGMILLYPAFNIADQVKKYASNPLIPDSLIPYGKTFISSLTNYDVYEHIAAFDKPVLIVHGTNDRTVPISYSEKAQTIYSDCELKKILGAGHGFNAANYSVTDYDSLVWGFVDEYLAKLAS